MKAIKLMIAGILIVTGLFAGRIFWNHNFNHFQEYVPGADAIATISREICLSSHRSYPLDNMPRTPVPDKSIKQVEDTALTVQEDEVAWIDHALSDQTYWPPMGYVPDKETAIRIAVAAWTPIYGEKEIESEKPYRARLKNEIWYVTGTLPEGMLGGTAVIRISQADGRILGIIHGE